MIATPTSAGRAFGSGCFQYSAPVREPKHIGARPKGHSFWPRLRTEAIEGASASVFTATEAIDPGFCLGFECTRGHMGLFSFFFLNSRTLLASVFAATEAIGAVFASQLNNNQCCVTRSSNSPLQHQQHNSFTQVSYLY